MSLLKLFSSGCFCFSWLFFFFLYGHPSPACMHHIYIYIYIHSRYSLDLARSVFVLNGVSVFLKKEMRGDGSCDSLVWEVAGGWFLYDKRIGLVWLR